jgi:hypothetical protein
MPGTSPGKEKKGKFLDESQPVLTTLSGHQPRLAALPLERQRLPLKDRRMIDFERVWLPQVVGYARRIANGQLQAEWLGESAPSTSIIDPDELHEQLFDDLDADAIWAGGHTQALISPELAAALSQFLNVVRSLDGSDVQSLVRSSAWMEAVEASRQVVLAACTVSPA